MCGRYSLTISMGEMVKAFGVLPGDELVPRYNIAPTQTVPVVCQNGDGTRHLRQYRWGLIPHWAKDASIGSRMINARCETVAEKPAFRGAIRYRRCLIPASGFFEWKQSENKRVPFYIRRQDQAPMAFAGIWETWKGQEETIVSCSILTTGANSLVSTLHDRMPVILSSAEYETWLDREVDDPGALAPLYRAFPSDLLEAYEVSTVVNKFQNDSEECIKAVGSGILS
jgi:putative SOS response-associated peptidase YedK